MKINIGNVIQDQKGRFIIATLTDLAKHFKDETLNKEEFFPVKITKEILAKLDAEKRIINDLFTEYSIECPPPNYNQNRKYCFRFWFGSLRSSDKRYPDDIKWCPYGSGTMHNFPITFLHEFQNTYSTIKGEELDVSSFLPF